MTLSSSNELLRSNVKQFWETNVRTVADNTPVKDVLETFRDNSSRPIYTTTESGVLSGVITAWDLTKLNAENRPTVARDLATTEKVVGITQDAELWQLLKIMNGENAVSKHFDQLPVLDGNKKPIGVVSRAFLRERLSEVQVAK